MKIDPVYRHIGLLIKTRRKILGLKQKQLAAKLGISRGSLANIETGRQNMLVHQLYRLANALELEPVDLLPQKPTSVKNDDHTALPLPNDLSVQQKEQITRMLLQVDTEDSKSKGKNNVKKA